MGKLSLKDRIRKGLFLLDGAMGTELFAAGIEAGVCNDYLNIESPDLVLGVHQRYLKAGSDAVLTNTFGANKYSLERHDFADKVIEINSAAAKIARKAAGVDKYVLGDIGSSGEFLEPLGTLTPAELENAFAIQAKALSDGDVDGFIVETMTAIEEIETAVKAVKLICDLPVFASMSFNTAGDDFKTMMGVSVETAVERLIICGTDAVGFNCGSMPMDSYVKLAEKFVSAVKKVDKSILILAEPNAGQPELVDGKAVYKLTPQEYALGMEKIYSAGVSILGGCCGTTPSHIKAVAEKLKK